MWRNYSVPTFKNLTKSCHSALKPYWNTWYHGLNSSRWLTTRNKCISFFKLTMDLSPIYWQNRYASFVCNLISAVMCLTMLCGSKLAKVKWRFWNTKLECQYQEMTSTYKRKLNQDTSVLLTTFAIIQAIEELEMTNNTRLFSLLQEPVTYIMNQVRMRNMLRNCLSK